MDSEDIDLESLRGVSRSLVTAILHNDDEAVDFLLVPMGEWELRGLCLLQADFVAQQIIALASMEGIDPLKVWSTALSEMHGRSQ